MWKNALDIFPGEWVGTYHEEEWNKEIGVGDVAEVIVDSQFQDYYPDTENKEELPRRVGQTGTVIEFDTGDEWAYKLMFADGGTNWFKRYCLKKV